MKYAIRNKKEVIFEAEGNSLKKVVELAVKGNVSLFEADLREADLRWANIRWADLRWANLRWANLRRADLRWANLIGADLRLADLRWANLRRADLRWANLIGADLRLADLTMVDLREANLTNIKEDFYKVLNIAKDEIQGLRSSLVEGRVDGSQYEGECACLVGTIANIRHDDYRHLEGISPDSERPSEKFFLAIKKGDTPKNNPVSKIIVEWIDEYVKV